ncbi:MAG: hypothetical protein AMXMBFR84_02630 [Candidatus Hydrogenedentota bacterium]
MAESGVTVHVSENPALAAAERLVRLAGESGSFSVAVSGGSTPRALFTLLAGEFRSRMPWSRVAVFQVDERCVPPDNPLSNWKMLQETLLDIVPEIRAYRMEAERGVRGAEDYARVLREHIGGGNAIPVFDVVLLGMGADGHTASLFPGADALHEQAKAVVYTEPPNITPDRVTLTFPVINAAKHKWFLATGSDKAPAFQRAQRGEVPAGLVTGAEWFVDSAVVASK